METKNEENVFVEKIRSNRKTKQPSFNIEESYTMKLYSYICELQLKVKFLIFLMVVFPVTVVILIKNLIFLMLPNKCLTYLHKDIKGKIALISGGASGLGRAIALALAKKGAIIVLWDMNQKGNEETAQLIKEIGGDCFPYTVDISKREMIYSTAKKVTEDVGSIDILVNNAGISGSKESVLHIMDNSFAKTMDINFCSHVWTVNAFLPAMIEAKSGHIVSMSSLSGICAEHLMEYSSSKFAVCGFIESLRIQLNILGHSGISTTLICPSYIDTPLHTEEFQHLPVMKVEYATEQIIDGILMEKELLIIPNSCKLLPLIKAITPTFIMTKCYSLLISSNKMKKML